MLIKLILLINHIERYRFIKNHKLNSFNAKNLGQILRCSLIYMKLSYNLQNEDGLPNRMK